MYGNMLRNEIASGKLLTSDEKKRNGKTWTEIGLKYFAMCRGIKTYFIDIKRKSLQVLYTWK